MNSRIIGSRDVNMPRLTLNKPFDLKGPATSEKMAQIDAMFEELYRVAAASVNPTQWMTGPWTLDSVKPTKNVAGIRPWDLAAGTYHNWSVEGLDNCVAIELYPAGDVTITGLKQFARIRRFVGLINLSGTNSITLAHENSGSTARYRFRLPGSEDIVIAPGQAAWMYYSIGNETDVERWQLFITPHDSGGLSGGGRFLVEDITLTHTQIQTLNSVPIDIVSGVSGKVLIPIQATLQSDIGATTFSAAPVISVVHTGRTTNLMAGTLAISNVADTPVTVIAGPNSTSLGSSVSVDGLGLALRGAADRTLGSGSFTFTVAYYEQPAMY